MNKSNIVLENHYGTDVFTNTVTDTIRRDECMCLFCENMSFDKEKINDYVVKTSAKISYKDAVAPKRLFDVTITRFGCVSIIADNEEDALEQANALPTDKITWNDDWSATDAIEE